MRKGNRQKVDSELLRDIVWGVQHDAFDDKRGWGRSLMRAWSVGALDEQLASGHTAHAIERTDQPGFGLRVVVVVV